MIQSACCPCGRSRNVAESLECPNDGASDMRWMGMFLWKTLVNFGSRRKSLDIFGSVPLTVFWNSLSTAMTALFARGKMTMTSTTAALPMPPW